MLRKLTRSLALKERICIFWVIAILGIPTGGPESSSLTNIAMRYSLLMYKDSVFFQERFNICLILLWRFLDDIFGIWFGDEEVLKEKRSYEMP